MDERRLGSLEIPTRPAGWQFALATTLYLCLPEAGLMEYISADLPPGVFQGEAEHSSSRRSCLLEEFQLEYALAHFRQEYIALFCRPQSGCYLAPYESIQRKDIPWNQVTDEIARLYWTGGFEPASLPTSPRWLSPFIPDHIGFELGFISAYLEAKEEQGVMIADEQPMLTGLAEILWYEHLTCWAEDYGQRLENRAATPLYRFLGRLTVQLLEDDPFDR